MVIIVYWFLIGIGTSLIVQDNLLFSENLEGGSNYSALETSAINYSSFDSPESNTLSKWKTALSFLFGFKLPETLGAPAFLRGVIAFINWFVLLLTVICLYKIGNPLSSA